jgi:hypothetical protein
LGVSSRVELILYVFSHRDSSNVSVRSVPSGRSVDKWG